MPSLHRDRKTAVEVLETLKIHDLKKKRERRAIQFLNSLKKATHEHWVTSTSQEQLSLTLTLQPKEKKHSLRLIFILQCTFYNPRKNTWDISILTYHNLPSIYNPYLNSNREAKKISGASNKLRVWFQTSMMEKVYSPPRFMGQQRSLKGSQYNRWNMVDNRPFITSASWITYWHACAQTSLFSCFDGDVLIDMDGTFGG